MILKASAFEPLQGTYLVRLLTVILSIERPCVILDTTPMVKRLNCVVGCPLPLSHWYFYFFLAESDTRLYVSDVVGHSFKNRTYPGLRQLHTNAHDSVPTPATHGTLITLPAHPSVHVSRTTVSRTREKGFSSGLLTLWQRSACS